MRAASEVNDRTEGFLWFRGPSATSGYYQNRGSNRETAADGAGSGATGEFAWVNSGDRAYRADGEIYVTGRVKDIIIKGGRNLYPHEVEELAARAEGIRKGCIVAFGLKDEATGTEKLIVVAETRERDASRRAVNCRGGDGTSFARAGACRRIASSLYRREAFRKLRAENCAARKPNNFISPEH